MSFPSYRLDRAIRATAVLLTLLLAFALAAGAHAQETTDSESESGGGLLQIRSLPDPTEPLAPFEGRIVNDLTIAGNNVTRQYVIDRELRTRVGEPLRIQLVREELVNLEDLDIFSSVTVTPTETPDGVALEYDVSEMPWLIPYLAFRYTEDDGFSVGPAFSSLNMLGRAISTSGRVLFGGATTFQLLFSWPWITGNHVSIDLFAAHQERDDVVRQFGETSTEITPWIGTHVGRHGRLKAGLSWFRMESDRAGITLSENNVDNLFRLGVGAGYDSRDSRRTTFQGWHNEIQAFYTGGPLGGDGDFWTVDLDIRRFQPVVERQAVVLSGLLTLQSGTPGVHIPAGIDSPSYMDYAIGGATTVRGWDNVVLGRELFGKNQLLGTIEYKYLLLPLTEFVILDRWPVNLGAEIAAFADYGIAWSEDAQFNSDRGKTGFGIGFRPLVPTIEALRLDLAVSSEGDVRFHFGVRTKFEAQRLRLR